MPDSNNYLQTINDSACEVKESLTSKINIKNNYNNINSQIKNDNNKIHVTHNGKIKTFEVKTKNGKSVNLERKLLNSCNNSVSFTNINFAKNKKENLDFKSTMLNKILGNLIVSKKQASEPFSETQKQQAISEYKNPLNNFILKTKTLSNSNNYNAKLNSEECSSLVKDDYLQISEVKTEENAAKINKLKAYERSKMNNNEVVLSSRVSNSFHDECDDLDESASLINFNNNFNKNNMNKNSNSFRISFNESSARKSRFMFSSGNKQQLKFNLVMKMHDYSNSNLVKIKLLGCKHELTDDGDNRYNYGGDYCDDNGNNSKNLEHNENNLNQVSNQDAKKNKETIKDLNIYNNEEKREEVFFSFANNNNNNNNNYNTENSRAAEAAINENLIKKYFSNQHLKEVKVLNEKENTNHINTINISRLNKIHKSRQSPKNTSNIDFYTHATNSYTNNTNTNGLVFKEKRKFLSNSFLNILSFLKGKEIRSLYYAFKQMRLLIIDSLMMEINRKLLNVFRTNCGHFLDLQSKKLSFKKNLSKNFLIF